MFTDDNTEGFSKEQLEQMNNEVGTEVKEIIYQHVRTKNYLPL